MSELLREIGNRCLTCGEHAIEWLIDEQLYDNYSFDGQCDNCKAKQTAIIELSYQDTEVDFGLNLVIQKPTEAGVFCPQCAAENVVSNDSFEDCDQVWFIYSCVACGSEYTVVYEKKCVLVEK